MRRMANSALLPRPNIDHSRPSRRVIAQIALALDPKTPENIRPKSIIYEPRTASNISATRCVTHLDTSGSMLGDPTLISNCIKELPTICTPYNTTPTTRSTNTEVCHTYNITHTNTK